MAATTLLFADNASTVLATSITAAATTCTLAPGTGSLFPSLGANQAFPMSFVDAATGLVTEIVKVTAISGDTVTTMVRGQEGTAARAWLAGDIAASFWTGGALGAASMAQIGPLQQGTYGYAVDSGSANAIVLTLSPAITTYVDGLPINFKAAANNTGATTINVNGVGAVALQGAVGALQGGEIVAGKTYEGNYNSTSSTFVLLGQGGGAEQIAPATQPLHAVQFGQVSGVVGQVRNLVMSVAAASATATLGADELIVETALGGLRYCIYNFNLAINLATVGAGGMDTGTAPVSGYVALYAIFNPTTAAANFLATNATSIVAPSVYGAGHMPSGYTASALVAVWPTNASSQFTVGYQRDRKHYIIAALAFSGLAGTSYTAFSLASIVPKNAVSIGGTMDFTGTSGVIIAYLAGDAVGTGEAHASFNGGSGASCPFRDVPFITAQTVYRAASGTGVSQTMYVSEYDI